MLKYFFLLSFFITASFAQEGLEGCPDKPNCVSTQASLSEQKIEPIRYTKTMIDYQTDVSRVLQMMGKNQIVSSANGIIHARFVSKFFKFVDDFEIYYDQKNSLIQIRSASQVGYYDFGVNRKRAEKFKTLF